MSDPTSDPRATRPPAVKIMRNLRLEPDPWQIQVLEAGQKRILLNCSRQAGKSTVVAILSLVDALFFPRALVLLLSRSHRQSTELFRLVGDYFARLGSPFLQRKTKHELQLTNGSRIVSLPCQPDTIRGFANVHILVIDEASRVPDDLYRAVRPMLAVSGGRLICLSTPYGKRGFFYEAWANGGAEWARIEVPARDIPRITPAFLEEERRCLGESWFRQEYCCSFEALEGLVYPDFARCVVPGTVPPAGRLVGGMDFGFHNPFAAVWGVVDREGVLWLTGEHYSRHKPLSYHVDHLPKGVRWYADPAGAADIAELRCAGLAISRGLNALRPGIAAVSARLESGRLRIIEGSCPNLLAEAALYHYATEAVDRRAETPVDENNHALAALRYLISRLDVRQMAKGARSENREETVKVPGETSPPKRPWLSIWNEKLWHTMG